MIPLSPNMKVLAELILCSYIIPDITCYGTKLRDELCTSLMTTLGLGTEPHTYEMSMYICTCK